MLEIKNFSIAGMHHDGCLLWLAAPEERLVAGWDAGTGQAEKKIGYEHEIWDVCPNDDGVWIVSGGGSLGRQIILWSLREERGIRKFNCPDGAGAGVRDVLAFRRRPLAHPVRHGLSPMSQALVIACAACLSSAFGDRTYTWPYFSLFAMPFLIAAVIGGVLAYYAGVRPRTALRALRRVLVDRFTTRLAASKAAHLGPRKETT